VSKRPPIKNTTTYPTATVQRIVYKALAGWKWLGDTSDWLTIEVKPEKHHSAGEGDTIAKGGKVRVVIQLGRKAEFPRDQRGTYGGKVFEYTFNTWHEALFVMTAHESWHVWNGPGERKAEEYALRYTRKVAKTGWKP
jgi:hypothetical protein